MNNGEFWTKDLEKKLDSLYTQKDPAQTLASWAREIAPAFGKSSDAIRHKAASLGKRPISESVYPVYDKPLVMKGDALILSDVEFPFHNAEFVNSCIEIARTRGIRQLIMAGDAMHFSGLSGFEPNWQPVENGGIDPASLERLYEIAGDLEDESKEAMLGILEEAGMREEVDGTQAELSHSRRYLKELSENFDEIHFVIGNHEGRLLRTLERALSPGELLRLLDLDGKWKIAPYYYSWLVSNGVKYRVTHPKNATKFSARRLAGKYQCNIIMGHNHHLSYTTDPSGQYLAVEIGCCVDEERLPYAAQRDNAGDAHVTGACFVVAGKLHLLNKFTDWQLLTAA